MTPEMIEELTQRNIELKLQLLQLSYDLQKANALAEQWRHISIGWQQVALAANEKARILEERRN